MFSRATSILWRAISNYNRLDLNEQESVVSLLQASATRYPVPLHAT